MIFIGLVRQNGVHSLLYLNKILDFLYHYWFVTSVHTSIISSSDPLSTANGYRVSVPAGREREVHPRHHRPRRLKEGREVLLQDKDAVCNQSPQIALGG